MLPTGSKQPCVSQKIAEYPQLEGAQKTIESYSQVIRAHA